MFLFVNCVSVCAYVCAAFVQPGAWRGLHLMDASCSSTNLWRCECCAGGVPCRVRCRPRISGWIQAQSRHWLGLVSSGRSICQSEEIKERKRE